MTAYNTPSDSGMDFFQACWHVWTHPGPEAFRTILRESNATAGRAFLWIAIAALAAGVISSLLNVTFGFGAMGGTEVWFLACSVLLTPIFAIIGLAVSAAIYHAVAKLFGGTGTWDALVYSLATISVPGSFLSLPGYIFSQFLVNAETEDLQLAPAAIWGIFSLVLGLYVTVLFISAIAAVEEIETWKAVAVYFIPVLVGVALGICLFLVIGVSVFSLLGVQP